MLIQPYQASWADTFLAIANVLQDVLGPQRRIEHVGSTSVPGLAAKPIIDIDVVFTDEEDWARVKTGLLSIGYAHHGDQGILGREVFKRGAGGPAHSLLDRTAHHLYVCPVGGKELLRHCCFRDRLKASENAREAYGRLKLAIAEKAGQERKLYAQLKEKAASQLIAQIMAGEI